MNTRTLYAHGALLGATALLVVTAGKCLADHQPHEVDGMIGSTFGLVAAPGVLSTPEGNSLYFWGYGTNGAQYSGPTLIVSQGVQVTIFLTNKLPVRTSMVFPGQPVVTQTTISGSSYNGLLAREAAPANLSGNGGGVVRYRFTPNQPGTYLYHSGTRSDLQTEMGLVGALIVRPTGYSRNDTSTWRAYAHADSAYDHEYLFLLSDMDEKIHNAVEARVQSASSVPAGGLAISVDMSKRFAVYWFMNGRCGPDTMLPRFHNSLPVQPYDCFPLFRPGEKVLMRVIGGGSDEHPLHHHGNHAKMIAQDGRLLRSTGGSGADLSRMEFTVASTPGGTVDTIFTWTGKGLGWDPYGHKPEDPLATNEDPADHGKPFPVVMPAEQQVVYGMMYGGSPFLGSAGQLPPGEGGFNPNNGFMYMWHSHSEKEIVNNDIFPGGMLTLALIEAWPYPPSSPVALGSSTTSTAASRRTAAPVIAPTAEQWTSSFGRSPGTDLTTAELAGQTTAPTQVAESEQTSKIKVPARRVRVRDVSTQPGRPDMKKESRPQGMANY